MTVVLIVKTLNITNFYSSKKVNLWYVNCINSHYLKKENLKTYLKSTLTMTLILVPLVPTPPPKPLKPTLKNLGCIYLHRPFYICEQSLAFCFIYINSITFTYIYHYAFWYSHQKLHCRKLSM